MAVSRTRRNNNRADVTGNAFYNTHSIGMQVLKELDVSILLTFFPVKASSREIFTPSSCIVVNMGVSIVPRLTHIGGAVSNHGYRTAIRHCKARKSYLVEGGR